MKAIALVPFFVALACQPKTEETSENAPSVEAKGEALAIASAEAKAVAPEPMTDLELDLDRLCNAEERSGALDLPTGDRALHTGIWLAKNIETQEVRDFVAALTKLGPEERIALLQGKLAEHTITQCEIVHAWKGTP